MGNTRVRVATGRPPRTRWTLGLSLGLLLVLSLTRAPQIAAVPQIPAVIEPQAALPPLSGPGIATISNGRIEVDGQPFFPFGFYEYWNATPAQLIADAQTLSAAGFNTIHAAYLSGNNFGAFLDAAAARGVRVLAGVDGSSAQLGTVITNYKTKPALLGYSTRDDVDSGASTHAHIQALYNQAKTGDPNHLAYVSGYVPTTNPAPNIGTFAGVTDLLAMQTYPVNRAPIKLTSRAIDSAVNAAAAQGRVAIANNQSFNWSNERAPNALEARNMTYQSIAQGAKGIIYYSYRENTDLPTEHPALWTELKSLVPEINTLAPVILTTNRTEVLYDFDGDRFASYWVYQGKVYVIVINTSATAAKTFSLPMPAGTTGPAVSLFTRRPSGMTFTNGQLSGTVNPHDVHVYVIDTNAGGTPPPPPPPPSPGNLALNRPATGSAPCATSEGAAKAVDGTTSGNSKWCSLVAGTKTWQVDLGSTTGVSRFVVKHAGTGGEPTAWNTRDFTLQVSTDNRAWTTVATVTRNGASETSHPVAPLQARYVRLNVTVPTNDGNTAARIYEVEVYGP